MKLENNWQNWLYLTIFFDVIISNKGNWVENNTKGVATDRGHEAIGKRVLKSEVMIWTIKLDCWIEVFFLLIDTCSSDFSFPYSCLKHGTQVPRFCHWPMCVQCTWVYGIAYVSVRPSVCPRSLNQNSEIPNSVGHFVQRFCLLWTG